jgi:alpha-ketoglutaric semialdehyde dehydrogenase
MIVYTQREPLGEVSVITPWNFAVSIPARKIAPALITGNTAVFKPSSDAPLSGYRPPRLLLLPASRKASSISSRGARPRSARRSRCHRRCARFSSQARPAPAIKIHRSVSFVARTQLELGRKNPLPHRAGARVDGQTEFAYDCMYLARSCCKSCCTPAPSRTV